MTHFSNKQLLQRLFSQHRGTKTGNYFKNPKNKNSYLEKIYYETLLK